MKIQKGISTLVGIIIIIAVVAIAFGGVFAYQYFTKSKNPSFNAQLNPNPETADWKTYKNDEYGFEIKYPESLYAYEDKTSGSLEIISTLTQGQWKNLTSSDVAIQEGFKKNHSLAWISYIKDKTLDEYYNLLAVKPNNIDNFLTQQIDMGGSAGYRIYYHKQISSKEYIIAFYIVSDKNKKGIIAFSTRSACDEKKICEKYVAEFDKVISTFKFIK